MFKTKKQYDVIGKELKIAQWNHKICLDEKNKIAKEKEELECNLEEAREEVKRLEGYIEEMNSMYASHNTVTLTVRDDLTQVTPTVKVKPEVFDKMVELGYLDDNVTSENKSHLMQTAMLVIGSEALEQIVESMTQPVHDD